MQSLQLSRIKTEDLARALQKSAGFQNEVRENYYSYVQRNPNGEGLQAVYFISAFCKNYQRNQAAEWYAMVKNQWSADFENCFFVFHGDASVKKIKDRNSICIDESTGKYYINRHDKKFNDVIDAIVKSIQFDRCLDKVKVYNSFGPKSIRTFGDSVVAYVLVAVLILVYWRVNGGAAYEKWAVATDHPKEYYRMFTYMFCHAGIIHLLGNSASLIVFGTWLSRLKGGLHTFLTFIVGGFLAGAASLAYHSFAGTDAMTVGASGAIFAIYGAYTFANIVEYGDAKEPIKRALILLAINCFGNVDIACHVGGFLAGLWMGFLAYGFAAGYSNRFADKAMTELEKLDIRQELDPAMKG